MRIAVFTKKTTFHKGYGGLETQTDELCRGLSKRGHEITVFSPKWEIKSSQKKSKFAHYVFVDCVYRMGPVFGFFGSMQKSNWINRSVEEFSKFHKKEKFDIVLAQSSAGLGVIRNKEELGIKVISISHGTIISEFKTFLSNARLPNDFWMIIKNAGFTLKNFFRRQRDFVHGSDKIIAVSEFVKKALIEETFTFEDKIKVIHNGVDSTLFKSKTTKKLGSNNILYVGQMIKSKGIFEFLKMFSNKEMLDKTLYLVGGGEDLEKFTDEAKKPEYLTDSLKVVGKLSHQETIEKHFLNEKYGVFVFPTLRYEGLPMVLVEAMFSGLPVVAYNMGGVSDAVVDGETGYLVEPEDINDFKEKVLKILEDKDLRDKMRLNSLQRAKKHFTLEIMLDKYEDVILEVLS